MAACSSVTNQLMAHHNPALKKERITKCTLYVAIRRTRRTHCKAAKETFVATIKEGVGPGVNIELIRLVRKVAIADVAADPHLRRELITDVVPCFGLIALDAGVILTNVGVDVWP